MKYCLSRSAMNIFFISGILPPALALKLSLNFGSSSFPNKHIFFRVFGEGWGGGGGLKVIILLDGGGQEVILTLIQGGGGGGATLF